MGFLSAFLGGAAAKPIDAIGNAFDKIFTSDDERSKALIVLNKLRQQPGILQVELNKIEAAHRSLFVAGWRPSIGWTCSLALFIQFIVVPCASFFTTVPLPSMSNQLLFDLVLAMLGMGTLRTVEKLKGSTR